MNAVSINRALRPERFNDVLGQSELIERLRVRVDAAKHRGEPLEHTILDGPPGLGKTTIAHVLANEMGGKLFTCNAPALTKAADVVGILMKLGRGDVLFIDEIHRLTPAIEELFYPALEDYQIQHVVGEGNKAQVITIPLPPFTLIGATTRAGAVTQPMRARFGIQEHLELYCAGSLAQIISANAAKLNATIAPEAVTMLAERSRGTPRVANRLLRAAWDYAQVRAGGVLDAETMGVCLKQQGIDPLGLNALDRSYLLTILNEYNGGPVGIEALAATMSESPETLSDCVEPYLLRKNLLRRTRAGRVATDKARAHLM
jgi:Holliday junction DNA helicase RuvB